jgi:hypothetical protein
MGSSEAWFNDPLALFRTDKIAQFWPTMAQAPADRINAATRFIIYGTCVVYLIKRDVRVFVLAAMILGVIYVMSKLYLSFSILRRFPLTIFLKKFILITILLLSI